MHRCICLIFNYFINTVLLSNIKLLICLKYIAALGWQEMLMLKNIHSVPVSIISSEKQCFSNISSNHWDWTVHNWHYGLQVLHLEQSHLQDVIRTYQNLNCLQENRNTKFHVVILLLIENWHFGNFSKELLGFNSIMKVCYTVPQ